MGRVYAAGQPFPGAPPRSASAEEYFSHNNVAFISGRTAEEDAAFTYAMWDMGRLYAYEGCEIVVLPELSPKSSYPGSPDDWGMENVTPYEFRGWCCSEFATALASSPDGDPRSRIVNFGDRAVQRVFESRPLTAVPWICQVRRNAATTHGCVETFRHRLRCPLPHRSSRRPVSTPPPPATPGRASAGAGHETARCSQINHSYYSVPHHSCYAVPHSPATIQCRAPPRGNGHVCVAGGEARLPSRGPVA